MKKAIVYDKWLHSLGGGEVVACHIARILRDNKYNVTVVGGKRFNTAKIKEKLDIDLTGVSFEWVWNDEQLLRNVCKDADIFFNTTFIDYTHGLGKKSYYYTHFPSPAYLTLKGMLFNYILVPLFSQWVSRVEFVTDRNEIIINRRYGYVLQEDNHILFTHENRASRIVTFSLFYENYYDQLVHNTHVSFDNAVVKGRSIRVDPHHNIIHFKYSIETNSDTIGLHIQCNPPKEIPHRYPKDRIILLFPKTLPAHVIDKLLKRIIVKFETRMRAGIYVNVFKRLESYTKILANSAFTQRWIRKYWDRDSMIVYPPVNFIRTPKKVKKKNMICSIGRFFTLGHGKKQEVMIDAFKQLYDSGYKDWELHLIGSIDISQSENFTFSQHLKERAAGYPITFHLNTDRSEMEKIVGESSIYWHATGYGEDEEQHPEKFEHFGIAPIEAISAGCIPVLYRGGGLPEIISKLSLSNLHLYTTIDELVHKTIHIAKGKHSFDNAKVQRLLEKHFSMSTFEDQITQLL
jgi:glycosyltransferase involved in cell wall biosynthesis